MLSRKFLLGLLPLILIILLASVLRLWLLGSVPISFSDDEIREVYSAYSIAHSGKDVFGNFLPLVFKMDGANTFGQVPIYISSVFFFFLPLNPLAARLPFALSGIFSVLFIYFIVKKIFDNNKIALLSAFVLSVCVWDLQLTRFAIETDIAMLMYLIGVCLFVYSDKKMKLFLLSMLFFFLGFYSYAAFKITLIPIMGILAWYRFRSLTKKHFFIILTTVVLAFGSFWYLSVTQNAASYSAVNGNFFFFQDKQTTSQTVELERRASNEPSFIKSLYHNKFTYWGRTFLTNYLTIFSPQYLFLNQEASGIYSIWGRGEFYVFELPLFLIGAFYLFLKKRKGFYLALALLLVSPLPSALGIGSPTWTSRSGFTLFWLCIFIGAGIYYLISMPKKTYYKYLSLSIILLFYGYSLTGYLSQYYFDWSRVNARYFSKSTKDLVEKINSYQSQGKHVIVSGATGNTFLHLAFYNKIDPSIVQKIYNNKPIIFKNVVLMENCWVNTGSPYDNIRAGNVYISKVSCEYKATPSAQIKEHAGSETVWNIYEK